MNEYRVRHNMQYGRLIVRSREGLEVPFTPSKWWMERVCRQILQGRFVSIPYSKVFQELARMPNFAMRRGHLDSLLGRRWNASGTFTKCPETISNFLYGSVSRFHSFGNSENEEM
ncbi:MAG: hypothetical protein EXQ58_07200 [Acidobacteria bacterium]|nr:hypothetical protein [Acidobacteriota bacterium]